MERRHSFDAVADAYDRHRPDYPDALYEAVFARTGLPARVLEVGCGTGKATRALLRRGCRVLAVEPGERLAAFTRAAFLSAPLEVVTGDFEDLETPDCFDVIWSAQAWHWVDPVRGPQRARELLAPGGRLVLAWNWPVGTSVNLQPAYVRQYGPEVGAPPGPAEARIAEKAASVEASGHFAISGIVRVPWSRIHTADDYVALMDTWSPVRDLGEAKLAFLAHIRQLITQAGGTLQRDLEAVAFIAAPVDYSLSPWTSPIATSSSPGAPEPWAPHSSTACSCSAPSSTCRPSSSPSIPRGPTTAGCS